MWWYEEDLKEEQNKQNKAREKGDREIASTQLV